MIKGVVYFAQGDYVDARKMRWHNGAFEWMQMTGTKASYFQSVRDSVGVMMYRGRNDGINNKRTVERARLLDWESSATTWSAITTALTTKEPENMVDRSSTTTQKNGDGDNTTTTITETSENLVDGVSAGSTTTTTTITTSKDQVAETDTTTTTTNKNGDGDNTTTTITESSTHKVGNITTGTVATTTSTTTRKDQVKEQDVFSSTTKRTVDHSDNDKTTTEVTDSTDHKVGNNANALVTTSTIATNSTIVESKKDEAGKTITTIKENTTKSTTPKEPTTGTGVNSSISETVTKITTPREPATGNGRNSSTTEVVEKATTKRVISLHTSVVTASKNFGSCDYDAKQYVITIGNFTSDNNSGQCVITLQESDDNSAFKDVTSVTATSAGTWRIFAHCQFPYRRFKISAVGTNCIVNNISITTSQTLYFVDPVILLDNYGKITRLFEYGAEMTKSLWIAQEGMLSSINKVDGTIDTYTHDRINIDELQTTAEAWNAKAMNTADVYMLWGWLNGLQRYYNTQLEGKGPDHDEGLPFERQGRVSQIVSYPSNFFISIDADDGYSCVMQFNQSGWHEIYRAPNKGERIYDMGFQPIYGSRPDRLWLNVGDDVVWLTMPSKILYAIQDAHAEYTHESVLVSAWHTAGMMDIEKLWQTLKIMADYLDGRNCWVEADYQTDEETEWHPIKNWYVESPSQKEDLNQTGSVNGKKLRYRLRLQSTDMYKTPKVNVVVLEAVGRVDIKMSYNFYFRNIKYKRDLTAEFEDIEPLDVQNVLDDWANKLKKLRMNSRWKIFDDKLVYLDAVQTSVLNELSEGYIGQITLNEL